MFEFITDDEDRGQVGIGTLIVFIAMVLVAAIAAGVLINTAGFLQTKSEETGEQSSAQVTDRLQPIAKTGQVDSSDGSVHQIDLVLQKSPGASDIDLSTTTIEFQGPDGVKRASLDGIDFTDSAVSLQDDDTSITASSVLNSGEDRVIVSIDLTDGGLFGNGQDLSLPEGGEAQIKLNTESGSTTVIRIKVPESTTGDSVVSV
ncbi:archaellin/type IV pilin N-terminal domain-containing protein [Halobium salinum]|uniref:Flagellin n=1 Tax=Halobium salinum TaxID=1364940 RepID=A0ABD5P7S4_9EURY|nr:archaellin/type IV pilin N-terminal domain-containing protein [Halobium salinum]